MIVCVYTYEDAGTDYGVLDVRFYYAEPVTIWVQKVVPACK
jgi:hypothetical protein